MVYDNLHIKSFLAENADTEYQRFSSSLIPTISPEKIYGVRLPRLRSFAKKIAKSDWRFYLDNALCDSFEETILQGIVIGYIDGKFDEILYYLKKFVPKIDNWSICDSTCISLKITNKYPLEMLELINLYLKSEREFEIRFAVVMLIDFYCNKEYCNHAFNAFDNISHEGFYVKMAVAWAIASYFCSCPKETMDFLKNNSLDTWTYNKALQKITESLKVDGQTKKIIRSMKKTETK